jgi:mRNA-degrading endonuclease YafQ of YafQ-DinJ toxin-antitoxin module
MQLNRFNMNWLRENSVIIITGGRKEDRDSVLTSALKQFDHNKKIVFADNPYEIDKYRLIESFTYYNKIYKEIERSLSELPKKILSYVKNPYASQEWYHYIAEVKKEMKVTGLSQDILTYIVHNYVNIPDMRKFIHKGYNIKKMEEIVNQLTRDILITEDYTSIILDGVWNKNDPWKQDDVLRMLFLNGRHYNTMLIISNRNLALHPALRSNCDYIFLLKDSDILKQQYQHWCGMFNSFDSFKKTMNSLENGQCLVINNYISSHVITDLVFIYDYTPEKIQN